jgi:hypothetical protein
MQNAIKGTQMTNKKVTKEYYQDEKGEKYKVTLYEEEKIDEDEILLSDLLDKEAFIKYYKCLAFIIGIKETIILQDLISKDSYFRKISKNYDGWFYNIQDNIYYDTAIPINSQKRIIDKIKSYNLLEINFKGMPARKYFKINYKKVKNLMVKGIKYRESLKFPCSVKIAEHDQLKPSEIIRISNKNKFLSKDKKGSNLDKDFSNEKSNQNNLPKNDKYSSLNRKRNNQPKKEELEFNKSSKLTKTLMNILFNKIISIKPKIHKDKYYSNKEVYKCERFIKYFTKGFPKSKCTLLIDWIEKNNIPISVDKGLDDFEKLFMNSIKVYDNGYYGDDKSKLPTRLSGFLYNANRPMKSHFLFFAFNEWKVEKLKTDKHPKITDKYLNKFLSEKDLEIKEKNLLFKYIHSITEEHKDVCLTKIKYNKKVYFREDIENSNFHVNFGQHDNIMVFINEHIRWLNMQAKNNNKFIPSVRQLKVNGYWWNLFEEWFKKNHGIKFFPNDADLKYKVKDYLRR